MREKAGYRQAANEERSSRVGAALFPFVEPERTPGSAQSLLEGKLSQTRRIWPEGRSSAQQSLI